jgi:hypothetical protein
MSSIWSNPLGVLEGIGKDIVGAGENLWHGVRNDVDTVRALFDQECQKQLLNTALDTLKNPGDTTTLTVTAGGQFVVGAAPDGWAPNGGQAQVKDTIKITRLADGKYQVTLTDNPQYGVNWTGKVAAGAGTGPQTGGKAVSQGDASTATGGGVAASAQVNEGVTNSVTLTVSSQQDAAKAATILSGVAKNNIPNDATSAPRIATGAALFDNTLMDIINPNQSGLVHSVVSAADPTIPISQPDAQFLQTHLTSYSTTLTLSAKGQASISSSELIGALGNKLPAGLKQILAPLSGSAQIEGGNTLSLTQTVTAGTASANCSGTPSTVAYTATATNTVSGKVAGSMGLGFEQRMFGKVDAKANLPLPLGDASGTGSLQLSATATYNLPKGTNIATDGDPESVLLQHPEPDKLQGTAGYTLSGSESTATPYSNLPSPVTTATSTTHSYTLTEANGQLTATSQTQTDTSHTIYSLHIDPSLSVPGEFSVSGTFDADITAGHTTVIPSTTATAGSTCSAGPGNPPATGPQGHPITGTATVTGDPHVSSQIGPHQLDYRTNVPAGEYTLFTSSGINATDITEQTGKDPHVTTMNTVIVQADGYTAVVTPKGVTIERSRGDDSLPPVVVHQYTFGQPGAVYSINGASGPGSITVGAKGVTISTGHEQLTINSDQSKSLTAIAKTDNYDGQLGGTLGLALEGKTDNSVYQQGRNHPI